jgi:hypothetical protein
MLKPVLDTIFSKGRKNLLELTNGSISINYRKKSMVVAVLAAYREQGIGLLYKWYNPKNHHRLLIHYQWLINLSKQFSKAFLLS